jgi:adenylate cyclase
MPAEIERKFLVTGDGYKAEGSPVTIRQGFLSTDAERVVRVRTAGEQGFITVKGLSRGATRQEFEYGIPATDADYLLDHLCFRPLIEKTRYKVPFGGFTWEVDEFFGDNAGLVVAEIELEREGQDFPKPSWIGREVTGDTRYYNANLVERPFKSW